MTYQPGIIDDVSLHARYIEFDLKDKVNAQAALNNLTAVQIDHQLIVGVGLPAIVSLDQQVLGLTDYPGFSNPFVELPSTQSSLWLTVRGDSRGEIWDRTRAVEKLLAPDFFRTHLVDGFKYDIGRDLTGYEDGTENPTGSNAIEAAIVQDSDAKINGSSFVAVQKWLHNFSVFDANSEVDQDNIIGRHRVSNEEFDAPESAHVKRTAQENFDPEAFLLRRSLPWSDSNGSGLMFVGFGSSFNAFDVQMNRMLGQDDDIVDGLFEFTKPISGGYYWCPPVNGRGTLDLSAIGL